MAAALHPEATAHAFGDRSYSVPYSLDPLVQQAHASGADEQARDDEDDAKHNPTA
jgi:hypothetical protein